METSLPANRSEPDSQTDNQLEGRRILITGAASGIGKAIAIAYGREGAKVAVASRTKATVDEVVKQIRDEGGEAIPVVVDVSERREWFAGMVVLYQATMRELVNLAPLFLPGNGVSKRTLKEWSRHGLLKPIGERQERNTRGEWRKVPTYRIGDLATAQAAWEDMKRDRPRRARKAS